MEIAKISSKGQITLPISVRKKLKLKSGDQVVIQEENGRFYFDNAALVAFTRIEQAFEREMHKKNFRSFTLNSDKKVQSVNDPEAESILFLI